MALNNLDEIFNDLARSGTKEPQPQGEQPQGEQPQGEQPQGEQPQGEQPQGEQPQGEQPQGEQPQGEQPQGEQPQGEQPQGGAETGSGEEEFFSVDDDEGQVEQAAPTGVNPEGVDYSSLASELGVVAKSREELVNSIKNKLKEGVQSIGQPEGVPDDLGEAIKVAQEGGDYLEFLKLKSIDYSRLSPEALVKHQLMEVFLDGDGNVDHEALNEAVDQMPDYQIKLQGNLYRKQLESESKAKVDKFKQSLELKAKERLGKINSAVGSIDKVDNFKVSNAQKANIAKELSSGKFEDLFKAKDGSVDYKRMGEAYFKIKYEDKMKKVLENKVKTNTKREMLDSLTNPQIGGKTSLPNPKDNSESGIDFFFNKLKNNK